MHDNQLDFVVTWVDGGDPAWREQKARFSPDKDVDARDERYRDWELFKYWFRGVEKFAPWVRKVHLITCGHVPEWLNLEHPKLHLVRHEDYIPAEYLPTFNSNVIEFHMHRIEGLSENFVYFNDDFFLTKAMAPTDFFQDGLPCDMLAFQPVVANPANPVMSNLFLNESLVVSKYFDKRQNVKSQPGKYFHLGYPPMYFFYNMLELAFPRFTGFYTVHGPMPLCKSTLEKLWEQEEEALRLTSSHRFRHKDDIFIYLARTWQMLDGRFVPKNVERLLFYHNVDSCNERLVAAIKKQKAKVTCINDANTQIDFEGAKAELIAAFENLLPERSEFEI